MTYLERKFKDEAWNLLIELGKNDPKEVLYSVIPMRVKRARMAYGSKEFADKMIDPKIPEGEICFMVYLQGYAGEDFKIIRESSSGKKVFYKSLYEG